MEIITFYTDAHIDKQVALQLRKQGIPVIRCQDVGMEDVSDEEHLIYASENRLSVVTKDSDFRGLHFQWLSENRTHFGIFICLNCQKDSVGKIVRECTTYFQLAETNKDIINELVEF
jgi:predicted nuclease of predicted toxin-antitoxin system